MKDLIDRQVAIDAVEESRRLNHHRDGKEACAHEYEHRHFLKILRDLPSAQPEIIRCEDCKFYSPMNRETKTGICNLIMHQNFGDNWFCAGAERRTDGNGRKEGTG